MCAATAARAIAAAGCGGSSDASSEGSPDTAAVTETTSSEETSTETTSTETSGGTETTSEAGLTGKCQDLVEANQRFGEAAASAGSGDSSDLDSTVAAFNALAEQPPDDLKDDFEALADVMADYAAAFADLDLEPGAAPTAAQITKLSQLG